MYLKALLSPLTLRSFDCNALSIIEPEPCLSSTQPVIFTCDRCLFSTIRSKLVSHRNSEWLMGLLTLHFHRWLLTNGYPWVRFLVLINQFLSCTLSNLINNFRCSLPRIWYQSSRSLLPLGLSFHCARVGWSHCALYSRTVIGTKY